MHVYLETHPRRVAMVESMGMRLSSLVAWSATIGVVLGSSMLVAVLAENWLSSVDLKQLLPLAVVLRVEWLALWGNTKSHFVRVFKHRIANEPVTGALVRRALFATLVNVGGIQALNATIWVALVLPLSPMGAFIVQLIASRFVGRYLDLLRRYDRAPTAAGGEVIPLGEARKSVRHATSREQRKERVISFTGLGAPESFFGFGFAFFGRPGSAKTKLMQILLWAFAGESSSHGRRKCLIFDPKRDSLPILASCGFEEHTELLNPFDERGLGWDMAADYDTPTRAKQLAAEFGANNATGESIFWNTAGRAVIEGLIRTFQECSGGAWELNHLYEIGNGTPEVLKHVLGHSQAGRVVVERYLAGGQMTHGVLAVVSNQLAPFSAVAPAISRTREKFSIRDWVESDRRTAVVLGTDPGNSEALEPLNRALLSRFAQLILDSDEENPPEDERMFVAIDELPQFLAYDLPLFSRLCREGRSKGVNISVAAQTVEALQATIGPEAAGDLLGLFSNVAWCSADSPATRALAMDLIGKGRGEDGVDRAGFESSLFNHFKAPTVATGITALAKIANIGFVRSHIEPSYIAPRLPEPVEHVAGYMRCGPERTVPKPLTAQDFEDLGISLPPL